MDVDTTQTRGLQKPCWQNQAIGSHHHDVDLCLMQHLLCSLCIVCIAPIQTQALWLLDSQAMLLRHLFDCRRLQLEAPACRSIGLCKYHRYFVARLDDGFESQGGKFGGACKAHPQGHFAQNDTSLAGAESRACLSILVLMRLRLSGDKYSTNTLPIK